MFKKIMEKLKGTAKETTGQLAGDEDLERAGQAQQDKARKEEEVEAKEAEAAEARRQAQGHSGEQQAREQ